MSIDLNAEFLQGLNSDFDGTEDFIKDKPYENLATSIEKSNQLDLGLLKKWLEGSTSCSEKQIIEILNNFQQRVDKSDVMRIKDFLSNPNLPAEEKNCYLLFECISLCENIHLLPDTITKVIDLGGFNGESFNSEEASSDYYDYLDNDALGGLNYDDWSSESDMVTCGNNFLLFLYSYRNYLKTYFPELKYEWKVSDDVKFRSTNLEENLKNLDLEEWISETDKVGFIADLGYDFLHFSEGLNIERLLEENDYDVTQTAWSFLESYSEGYIENFAIESPTDFFTLSKFFKHLKKLTDYNKNIDDVLQKIQGFMYQKATSKYMHYFLSESFTSGKGYKKIFENLFIDENGNIIKKSKRGFENKKSTGLYDLLVKELNKLGIENESLFLLNNIDDIYTLLLFTYQNNIFEKINQDLQVDITNLTLQTQIFFLKFLWEQTPEDFDIFKSILANIKNKEAFMTSFLACSRNPEMSDVILELAKYEGVEKIFEAYGELVDLQTEITDEDINSKEFLKAILSRGEQLIQTALYQFKNGQPPTEIENKYSQEFVKNLAFIRALINSEKTGAVLSKEEFNEKSPGYKIYELQGSPDHLQNTDLLSMMDEENYNHPEIFSKENFEMIFKNYAVTYDPIDKSWGELLQRNIAKDIINPKVTFFMIRDNKENLVSVCKIKKQKNGDLYVGTHYVDPDHQKDASLGNYVINYGISQFPDAKNIVGDVAMCNKSLERHINYGGFICTGTGVESDEISTSKEFFRVQYARNKKLDTKDKKLYPDEKLKKMPQDSMNDNLIQVRKFNGKVNEEDMLREEAKYYFEKGYCISRIFYEKVNGVSDGGKMYVTFERLKKDEEL